MLSASVAFGTLKPAGSALRLEQLANMSLAFVTFGILKPAGSALRLEQP